MPSPFPGVDPYLESQDLWPDFHARFIPALCDAISEQLPEPYVARIDERMNLVELPRGEVRQFRPDVAVVGQRQGEAQPMPTPGRGTLTLEPVTLSLKFLEEFRQLSIEILHRPDQKVVAVLELLSPSNKAGNSRRDYLSRRNGLMGLEVHLVELDFLVGGHRLPMEDPLPPGDFYALIARAECRPDCNVFAWTVRDPLPAIPVPLLIPDPDLVVDLAPLFASVYERARYTRSIDYRAHLTVPLDPDTRAWAEEHARASAR
jgi:hypothetical protein